VNETAKLIPNLVNRERLQYITMHALTRLLDLKPLMNSTDKLTRDYVHNNVLHDENIREKLKQLLIRQLRDENRRADLLRLLHNFLKTEQARDLFTDAIAGTLNNPEVRKQALGGVMSFVYWKLDDPETKATLKNMLTTYLAN